MKFNCTNSKFIHSNMKIQRKLSTKFQILNREYLPHHIYKIQANHGFKIQVLYRKEIRRSNSRIWGNIFILIILSKLNFINETLPKPSLLLKPSKNSARAKRIPKI